MNTRLIGAASALLALSLLLTGCGKEDVPPVTPDADGYYQTDGYYFRQYWPMDDNSLTRLADSIAEIRENYLTSGSSVYYSVIPDKSWYRQSDDPAGIDHGELTAALREKVKNAEYIELGDTLSMDDFYKTDAHWRQDSIWAVVDRLGEEMDFTVSHEGFTRHEQSGFCGLLDRNGESRGETLVWLSSAFTDNAQVWNYSAQGQAAVYDEEKLAGKSPYDVFLSGATPVVTIDNPDAADPERSLILFRDSFASSLAPLLLEAYGHITMIDLRYIVPSLMEQFVTFGDSDVLFLYCTAVANSSYMLKQG